MDTAQRRQRITDAAQRRHAAYAEFHNATMRLGPENALAVLRFSYCHTLSSDPRETLRMRARVEDMVNAMNPTHTLEVLTAMDIYRNAFVEWEKEIAAVMAP